MQITAYSPTHTQVMPLRSLAPLPLVRTAGVIAPQKILPTALASPDQLRRMVQGPIPANRLAGLAGPTQPNPELGTQSLSFEPGLQLARPIGMASSLDAALKQVQGKRQDFALIQTPSGIAIHPIHKPRWGFDDFRDLSRYEQLRDLRVSPGILALVSQRGKVRFNAPQQSPLAFAPIMGASAADRLPELIAKSDQVLLRLKQMEAVLGQRRDHRGIFAAMYRVITERAQTEMHSYIGKGDLRAAEFEGRLLIDFANYYFRAFDAYAAGDLQAVPEVWRSAFDAGRLAELRGYPAWSTTEIVGLSMVAHIVHDLPFVLKNLGFNSQDTHINAVYDHFNAALISEKDRIIGAIAKAYGPTDLARLEKALNTALAPLPGANPAPRIEKGLFSALRNLAKRASQQNNPSEIRQIALRLSDRVRILPGGN